MGEPITDHKIETRKKRVGVVEIARAAGVSPSAVSSVFRSPNGKGRVSEKTRNLILQASRDLGYKPLHAPTFSQIHPELKGFCFALSSSAGAKFRSGYFAELISYVTEALPESEANLQVCRFSVDTDYLANPELLPPPVRNNTVNRILCVGRLNVSFIEALRLRKVAIVYLCKEVILGGITSVLPDYAGGASAAIEFFLSQGHRDIAVGAGPLAADDTNILKQRSGIVDTLEKHKLELSNDFIYFSPLTVEGGRAVLDQILKHRRRPTALYCANDAMAMGAILQAKEHNLRVPEDLSVIGFDDVRFASAFTPPLTTIHAPLDEIARRGVEECNKIAQQGESSPENPHQTIVLPTKLVERKSTTAPA